MTQGKAILEYQVQRRDEVRWWRIMAAAGLMMLTPIVTLCVNVVAMLFPITSSTSRIVLVSGVPGLFNGCITLAACVLLATSNHVPPRGAGMTVWRWLAMVLTAGWLGAGVMQLGLLLWVIRNGTAGWGSRVEDLLDLMVYFSGLVYLLVLVSLCVLMRHVSRAAGRGAFFYVTLVAVSFTALIRMLSIALNLLRSFAPAWIPGPASLNYSRFYFLAFTASVALISFGYWGTIAYLAWSMGRRGGALEGRSKSE